MQLTEHAAPPARVAKADVSAGLTKEEAARRLAKSGPNAMPDTTEKPWRSALLKFRAPVPWMLETAVALQVVLGD